MSSGPIVNLEKYKSVLARVQPIRMNGRVSEVVGLLMKSVGPSANLGDLCLVKPKGQSETIMAEVVSFKDNHVLLMALGDMGNIGPGAEITSTGGPLRVAVDERLLGRVLDGLGRPLDGKGSIHDPEAYYSVMNAPPNPLTRPRIKDVISTGVRAIDAFTTVGKGQRIGIFSGAGVGKSTLLGMIARNTSADVNVIGLVGERGREVREFIEKDLKEEGLKRSVVVVATGDQPSLMRLKAAMVATSIAEYFRDKGKDVMLMMDSVTRFARAQREIGLAAGEPPATRGYTPSVFSMLPKLLERSGMSDRGSITGLYTVLVEADDMDEPVADTVRSILDGHIVLARRLAQRNHYPAIAVNESISRLMNDIVPRELTESAGRGRAVLATYEEAEDLINIGAYVVGSNPKIDYARNMIDPLNDFLRQRIEEKTDYSTTEKELVSLFK
jgi:flagellum-specific ATP synthase